MANFFLTRRAQLELLDIEAFSIKKWGEAQTDLYIAELYEAFGYMASNPDVGKVRRDRSFPFYMVSAGRHFAVYKVTEKGIIIATILHSRRNIEGIIQSMAYALTKEIEALEKRD